MAKSYRPHKERLVSHKMRYQVLMRDRFRCRSCGRSPATDLNVELNVDHIIPFSKGGETTFENLQTLCKECNIGKGALVSTADFPLNYNHNLLNLSNNSNKTHKLQRHLNHEIPAPPGKDENMEIKFNEENLKKLEETRSHYPTARAALMPTLWLAQEQFGWLSHDVMRYVGEVLDIPFEHVLGVAEFYTMYNKKPVGKYHLQVCTNVSCMLCGGYDVLDYIANKLDIKVGDTTPDGKITLSEAECLGSCGTAPMMQVNNYYEEDLSKDKIDALLDKYTKS